jgi:hypothetical protein
MGGYVANMGEKRNADNILVRQPGKNKHLEGLGIDGRINEHYRNRMGVCGRDSSDSE